MSKHKKNRSNAVVKGAAGKSFSVKKKRSNWVIIGVILVALSAAVFVIFESSYTSKQKKDNSKSFIPEFKKEGELTFFKQSTNKVIRTINIEIAEDNYERSLGLMYRINMDDKSGMLFVMEREEPQSFWMRNTYISLDIIYMDSNQKIVKIQKYTKPFSEESVPSIKKSKFVVEVIAGFCDKYLVEEGDYIKYKRETN